MTTISLTLPERLLSDADIAAIVAALVDHAPPTTHVTVNEQAESWRCLWVTDAAERLGISRATLDRHIADGDIPAVRLGSRVVIDLDDLKAFARKHKTRSGPVAVGRRAA